MGEMSIKIPAGGGPGAVTDIAGGLEKTEAAASIEAAGRTESADAVGRIAEQVAAGEIGRDEAVDLLLEQVLDSKMVEAAPSELRAELEAVLRDLIETDPHLKSLAAAIGPADD